MDTAFTNRQRDTLAAVVDTFVPSVSRDDDPRASSPPKAATSARTTPSSTIC